MFDEPPRTNPGAATAEQAVTDTVARSGRKESFYTLDAIRGVAAVAVLMFHAAALFHPIWMRSAYLAVDLFFALSGFVLAHAYGERLRHGLSAGGFMRIRLVRIMPLYLLGTMIAVANALVLDAIGRGNWTGGALIKAIFAALFMIPLPPLVGAPNGYAYPLDIPGWSLLFELLVNVFYAAAFRLITLPRTVALIGLALVGLVAADRHFNGLGGSEWATLWGAAPRVVFSFFAGLLIYRVAGQVRRRRRISPWIILAALFVLFVLPVPTGARWIFDLGCLAMLFPFVIWYCATALPGGRGQRAAFSLLGRMSYPLYAIHVPILGVVVSLLAVAGHSPRWMAPLTGVAFLALTIGCGRAADIYFDSPLRGLMATPRIAVPVLP